MHPQSQQRHLKDLLNEDQEPFLNLHLNNQNASFASHFRKNACFSCTTTNSPDLFKNSPLFSPAAGGKTPSHALFLNVPSKTAALLLESAMRIHQTSSNSTSNHKSKFHFKNPGFALLGSVIKRLTNRSHTPKLNSLKTGDDVITWADSVKTESTLHIRAGSDTGSMETSDIADNHPNSGNSFEEEEGEFVNAMAKEKVSSGDGDFTFCLSPLNTFRFALHTNPSPACLSPEFSSPATSPCHRVFQENVKYEEEEPSVKFQSEDDVEKEQNSPVSILESPFGDDEDEHGSDSECSYAFVQRSKQRLFQKLRKFEELAGLDSTELDMRFHESDNARDFVKGGMKRLLSDLISEEERLVDDDDQSVVKRVCERMESWKEMESNTIDGMVGLELKGEGDEWKKPREDISWTAKTLEFSIFMSLVDELVDDLVSLA